MGKVQELLRKRNLTFSAFVALFLLTLFASYSNHFNNGFQFDDFHTIVSNSYIRDLSNIPRFFTDNSTMSTHLGNRSYRPIVATLNAIDYSLGGMDPFYFHVSIFISYLALILLVYFLLLKLFKLSKDDSWNSYYALFGASFFALHTANAETINYIIARSDSFSTLCIVASLLLFVSRKKTGVTYLIPMAVGIYTKQVGVVVVPLIFTYAYLFEENEGMHKIFNLKNKKTLINSLRKTGPAFLIALSIFIINQIVLTKGPSASLLREMQTSRLDYFTTQWYVMAHYIGNFLLPINLSADPDIKVITTLWSAKKLLGFAVILALMMVAYYASMKKALKPIAFGILWFFITLIPTSTFHPLGQISNDHRVFLPFIGLFISTSWAFALLVTKYKSEIQEKLPVRLALLGAVFLLLFGHAYGTHQRNIVWSSSDTLWEDVAKKSPENGRGLMNYGLTLMRKGNYQETLLLFERAMELLPYYSYLHINMGVLKNAMGFPEEAEGYFINAIRYQRSNAEAYYYYARFLWRSQRQEEAVKFLEKGLEISPGHSGLTSFLVGVKNGSIKPVVKKIPKSSNQLQSNDLINLSLKMYNEGKYQSCIQACQKALEMDPNSAKAYNNMCIAYIRLNRIDDAIEAGKMAVKLDPHFKLAKNNLRWAKSLK
ncbi:MAG: tetratricopeptide repeat protein [Vicingaceae bacterium]